MTKFSVGVADRGCSVRLPRTVEKSGKGYYEDRRPASNMDPYVVSAAILSVTSLDSFGLEDLEKHYHNFLEFKKSLNIA